MGVCRQDHSSHPTLSQLMASTRSPCLTFSPHQYSSIHMPKIDSDSTWFSSMISSSGIFCQNIHTDWVSRGVQVRSPRMEVGGMEGKEFSRWMSSLSYEQFITSGSLNISCIKKANKISGEYHFPFCSFHELIRIIDSDSLHKAKPTQNWISSLFHWLSCNFFFNDLLIL